MPRWSARLPAVRFLVSLAILWAMVIPGEALVNGFVYDDGSQIVQNPWLRDPASIPQIFNSNVWAFAGPSGVSNYYRPLMHLLNMACFHLFGFQAWGFHLVSLPLHVSPPFLVCI